MLFDLFVSFFQIGLFSVGGGYAAIPLIQSQIVDRLGLLTLAEFTDLITVAEMTPGPIALNAATFVGTRCAGLGGALLCTAGCMLPSVCISLALAYVYYRWRTVSAVQTLLSALRPAVVALIAGAGLSILCLAVLHADLGALVAGLLAGALPDLPDGFRIIEAVLFAGALIVLRMKKAGAIAVLFGTGAVGTVAYLLLGLA